MSKADTHQYLSLPVDLTAQDLAREVATAIEITIDIRRPDEAEGWDANKIGVYCQTQSDAARFERAFEQRRWVDSKSPGGE